MRSITLALVAIFALLAVSAAPAPAQSFQDFSDRLNGTGTLVIGKKRSSLTSVTIRLERGGSAELRIAGDIDHSFRGRWFRARGNRIDLDVTSGFGNSGALARGLIQFNTSNEVTRIELTGRTVGSRFTVEFVPQRKIEWRPEDDRDAYAGAGAVRFQGRDDGLVKVAIKRDGRSAIVRMRTADNGLHMFEGVASREGRDGFEVSVTSYNGIPARGTLFATSKGTVFTSVPVAVNNDRLTAYFRATGEWRDDGESGRMELSLAGTGAGSIAIGDRRPDRLTRATVVTRGNGQADVTVRTSTGHVFEFGGEVRRGDARSITIRLTSSREADASGTLSVAYRGQSLESITGSGRLDSQPLTLSFSRTAASGDALTASSDGDGYFIKGRERRVVRRLTLAIKRDGRAEITVRFDSGTTLTFGGYELSRDAYSVTARITNSGDADASGTVNVFLGARGAINSTYIDGTIDGQKFALDFAR